MIQSFKNGRTEALFRGAGGDPRWRSFERVARRKLLMVDGAHSLLDLTLPPANRLEALKGDRRGQHSIRINDQWRVCFVWRDGHAHTVEIVDFH
jgi:proteic killer suppression protein